MNNHIIENDKKRISQLFQLYTRIILNEYKDIIPEKIRQRLTETQNFEDCIKIENTGTITLSANPETGTIHLPLDAYSTLKALSKLPEYGSDRDHKTHTDANMLINDNTYRTFVEHIILKGETPVEYFEEILLHETMHICGSHGSDALSEGFNELKTREIARKYNLPTSCCGYPKETKIAYELQQVFGKTICDKLAFSDLITRFHILRDEIGDDAVRLYADVYASMDRQFKPYIEKKYPGIDGVRSKCDEYDKIDYSDIHKTINKYKEEHNLHNSNQFANSQVQTHNVDQNQFANSPVQTHNVDQNQFANSQVQTHNVNQNQFANSQVQTHNVNQNQFANSQVQTHNVNQNQFANTRVQTHNIKQNQSQEDNRRRTFNPKRNLRWNSVTEKEKYHSLKKEQEEKLQNTVKKQKVLVKTMANGFVNLFALKFLIGISISIIFLVSLVVLV